MKLSLCHLFLVTFSASGLAHNLALQFGTITVLYSILQIVSGHLLYVEDATNILLVIQSWSCCCAQKLLILQNTQHLKNAVVSAVCAALFSWCNPQSILSWYSVHWRLKLLLAQFLTPLLKTPHIWSLSTHGDNWSHHILPCYGFLVEWFSFFIWQRFKLDLIDDYLY